MNQLGDKLDSYLETNTVFLTSAIVFESQRLIIPEQSFGDFTKPYV